MYNLGCFVVLIDFPIFVVVRLFFPQKIIYI